jgi:hypothetical protein
MDSPSQRRLPESNRCKRLCRPVHMRLSRFLERFCRAWASKWASFLWRSRRTAEVLPVFSPCRWESLYLSPVRFPVPLGYSSLSFVGEQRMAPLTADELREPMIQLRQMLEDWGYAAEWTNRTLEAWQHMAGQPDTEPAALREQLPMVLFSNISLGHRGTNALQWQQNRKSSDLDAFQARSARR